MGPDDEQLLATFAGQVAVAVDNARLYERQRQMLAELQQLHERLTEAEQAQLLGRERERIAGALHDRIEQNIFTIGVHLGALLEDASLDARLAPQLRELHQLSIAVADELRRAIFSLTGSRTRRKPHRRPSTAAARLRTPFRRPSPPRRERRADPGRRDRARRDSPRGQRGVDQHREARSRHRRARQPPLRGRPARHRNPGRWRGRARDPARHLPRQLPAFRAAPHASAGDSTGAAPSLSPTATRRASSSERPSRLPAQQP